MSNKHRGERKGYRPSFEDFFPALPRGESRGIRRTKSARPQIEAAQGNNIEQWREERSGSGGKASRFSIAVEAQRAA